MEKGGILNAGEYNESYMETRGRLNNFEDGQRISENVTVAKIYNNIPSNFLNFKKNKALKETC